MGSTIQTNRMTVEGLRHEIDNQMANGNSARARYLLGELWRQESGPAAAAFLVSRFERLHHKLPLLSYRLAILRSFTVEPIVPLLRAAAFVAGIELDIYLSDFNSYVQEIAEEGSQLYRFAPHAVILALRTVDLSPDLWRNFTDLTLERSQAEVRRVQENFCNWLATFRKYSQAHLLIQNMELPTTPSRGSLDQQQEAGQLDAINHINLHLRTLARQYSGVYIVDYDALIARHGRDRWHDQRKWLMMRMPIASPHLGRLAQEWLRFLHPLTGKVAKALVVDLDNTLWGGIVGEDGIHGIQLGPEHPGAAYQAVQRVLLDLANRGILLAVCSKNNPEDALEVLNTHPGMLLKPSHFAAMRINWADKAANLREIAEELNIGLDAVAFLDDNVAERDEVRAELPDVTVIELPTDPLEYAQAVRDCAVFERLSFSQEDLLRSEHYRTQQSRKQLEQKSISREDFYRSLEQEVEIVPLSTSTLARIAQLTNKTNQFNLTTRRYTEQEISNLSLRPDWYCFSLRVRDRFGDNGLVGVAMTRHEGEWCEIENFLLSCRVIGRTVETAFLSFLADHARQKGAIRLQGWFLPTKKNAPAGEFFLKHGFELIAKNETASLWSLDLNQPQPRCPEWIRLIVQNRGQ